MKTIIKLLSIFRTISKILYYRIFKVDYYKDLDEIPVWNWNKLREEGNLKYLLKADYSKEYIILNEVAVAYDNMLTDYYRLFVLNSEEHERIKQERDVCLAKLEALVSGDPSQMLLAKHLENELLGEKTSQSDFYEIITTIEQHFGFVINEKQMSVRKFYNYIKSYIKHGKESNKARRPDREGDI